MKKLLVALLVLAAVGFGAFAQDAAPTLTWSGGFGAGFAAVTDSGGTNVYQYSPTTWGPDRLRLSFNYKDGGGNYGLAGRFQYKGFNGGVAPVLNRINAWGKFLNGMVTVKAGVLDGYEVAGPIWDDYGTTDGKTGVWVGVSPMDGLTVGYFLPASTTAGWTFQTGIAGFAYSVKNVVDLNGGVNLGTTNASTVIFWGANVTAVKGLTLQGEGYIPLDSSAGIISIIENVGYNVTDALTVSAMMSQNLYGSQATNGKIALNFFPSVSYTVSDTVKVGAYVPFYSYYDDQGVYLFMDPMTCWGGAGILPAAADPTQISKFAFGAGPYVAVTQGKAKLTLGDSFYILPTSTNTTRNVLYGNIGFSF